MGGQGTFVGFLALERMHMGGQGAFVGFLGSCLVLSISLVLEDSGFATPVVGWMAFL